MASLAGTFKIGNASALLKSSATIQSQMATYQDTIMKINYANSSKTDEDYAVYAAYLQQRANTLNAAGTVTDLTKAATVQQEIVTAQHSNISSNIQRENINVMAGNGNLTDKYNVIVSQFQRAISIGDDALAQSLESQAYSVSQTIQYQAQEAATAAQTLGKANATAGASAQGNIVTSLHNALLQLNNDIKNVGEKGAENITRAWVNQNSDALKSMGVIIPPGSMPNYFDLVKGIANAQYNAYTLQAQIQQTYDPSAAQNTLEKAQNIQTGVTKMETLGGSLTYQQLNQAAQDPNMFVFDSASGKYVQTQETGYQYVNGQVAPTYSGIAGKKQYDQVFYLNANQTKQMTTLGLNFRANKSGSTGDGVIFQVTDNSPQWLKDTLGNTGEAKMYTDKVGNLVFTGSSSDGTSMSYYTLASANGLSGLFEHLPDGSTKLAGGNYGFDSGAAQLLVNMAENQQEVKLQAATAAANTAKIQLQAPQALPQIKVPTVSAPTPTTPAIQQTISTQSVQGSTVNPQAAASSSTRALQSSSGNIQSGGSGIKITGTTSAPVGMRI